MITIGNFKDINDTYDEVWFIVRSLKNGLPNTKRAGQIYRHVPQLSPSLNLFKDYLKWANNNEWNENCFMERYVPRFLEEMKSKEAKNALNTLYKMEKQKNILLVCFCGKENICHRSIVCGLMQGVGSNVNCNKNYKHFYDMYKKI